MSSAPPHAIRWQFADFELDPTSGELRRQGQLVPLQDKPFQLLALLVERAPQTVTRDEIRDRLWGPDTFVEFDDSLNQAVRKVREALGDAADAPQFVRTLPRRGYQFIAAVSASTPALPEPLAASVPVTPVASPVPAVPVVESVAPRRRLYASAALVMLGLVAGAVWLTIGESAPAPITSLVVLPFEHLGPDTQEEYFGDGLTEELINRLSGVRGLRVVARTTAFHFKGRTDDARAIARRLNVEALLTGSVRRQGDRLRITAHLSRGSDGVQLWSQTFDRRADDLFAVQEEISRSLTSRLGHADGALPAPRGTRNQEASRLLLLGNYHRAKFRQEDLEKALRYYQDAVTRDPTFAQAHAEMAYAYAALANAGMRRPADVYPAAFEAAHRALAIDETVPAAHTGLGIYHLAYAWDWPAAERALRRAIELNPCEAQAHHWYAHYFAAMERYPESLQASRRALECDPLALDLNHHLAEHYCAARDFDRCIAIEQQTLELDPQYFLALWKLRVAYLAQRRFPEAIETWRRAGLSAEADRLTASTRTAGEKGYWQEHIAMLLEGAGPDPSRLAPFLAFSYAQLGDTPKALDWLETAYQTRSWWMINVRHDWELDPLRNEPRFQELVRRMRFP